MLSRILSTLVGSAVLASTTLTSPLDFNQTTETVLSTQSRATASAPARRALLIGIGIYNPRPARANQQTTADVKEQRPNRTAAAATKGGPSTRNPFGNLDGPGTDVAILKEILEKKYGFALIYELLDQQATRAAILAAIQKHLIDDAAPGDIGVLYYSGHGSQVRNSKGGEEDQKDESLVPADSNNGAPDIRDKELSRLLLAGVKKGIKLTVILDSCHSGSAARGYPQEERGRNVDPIEVDVADPPGFEKAPEEVGTLVLSAAQDREEAKEKRYKGIWRGNFSYALSQVLAQPSVGPGDSAEQIFQRVTSLMRSEGVGHQPVMAGTAERRKGTIFGDSPVARGGGPTASLVKSLDGLTIELQGGPAMGIIKNTELKKITTAQTKPVRIRVTTVKGLNTSEAIVLDGDASSLKPGDLFVVDSWSAPSGADLRVWLPPPITKDDINRIAEQTLTLRRSDRIDWIDDPTTRTPNFVVQLDRDGWKSLMAGGRTQSFGASFPFSQVADRTERAAVFLNLPPSAEIRQAIRFGPGTERLAIEVSKSPADANYVLAGRIVDGKLQYAWVRPGVSAEDARLGGNPLPVRSDWVDGTDPAAAAARLEELAVTLSRIRAWLLMEGSRGDEFPYRLSLRNTRTREVVREGEVRQGESYDLLLVADEPAMKRLQDGGQRVSQRWIYVFSIDSFGKSYLLFNQRGNINNSYPIDPNLSPMEQPKVIRLGTEGLIGLEPPFGLDTYILLASEEPLPDPFVLEFDGIRSRGKGSEGGSKLAALLYGVGTASRGPSASTPLNWSIDRIILRSVGK
jgi:hypothetical protein